MTLIKLFIATVRWGKMNEHEAHLVKKASLSTVLSANYITHTNFSDCTTITLDR